MQNNHKNIIVTLTRELMKASFKSETTDSVFAFYFCVH